jgi:hypothetical protein
VHVAATTSCNSLGHLASEQIALFEKTSVKLARSAARVALVGLSGVGWTSINVEFGLANKADQSQQILAGHRERSPIEETSPETWVLWIYASNAARFEQSVRNTPDRLRVSGGKDARAYVFQLLHDWLCDKRSRPWLVILDNANDSRVFGGAPSAHERAGDGTTSC